MLKRCSNCYSTHTHKAHMVPQHHWTDVFKRSSSCYSTRTADMVPQHHWTDVLKRSSSWCVKNSRGTKPCSQTVSTEQ